MRVIYIAGPITGKPNFLATFTSVELNLISKGWTVLNPARLPAGMTEPAYMDICLAMVRNADAIMMLDGWEDSQGASCERAYALKLGIKRFYNLDAVPVVGV